MALLNKDFSIDSGGCAIQIELYATTLWIFINGNLPPINVCSIWIKYRDFIGPWHPKEDIGPNPQSHCCPYQKHDHDWIWLHQDHMGVNPHAALDIDKLEKYISTIIQYIKQNLILEMGDKCHWPTTYVPKVIVPSPLQDCFIGVLNFNLDVLTIVNGNEERVRVHEPCLFLPFLGALSQKWEMYLSLMMVSSFLTFFDILKRQCCVSILQCTEIWI